MKRALVVGIDAYPTAPLTGCVNDAVAIKTVLEQHGDGAPNFDVKLLNSDEMQVTSAALHRDLEALFAAECDTALFYFAGHGTLDTKSETGYIISQDGRKGSLGVSLAEILSMANRAHPRVRSTVVILDSCHSGVFGENTAAATAQTSIIGNGVTIMTACHREQTAGEQGGQGIFTGLLIDGLRGTAADVRGHITPASLYSLIDQTLGPWGQRPVYKANVDSFVTLRQVAPRVPLETLRRLPDYFPTPGYEFKLDPSYEPDRAALSPEQRSAFPENSDHQRVFRELQNCNRQGLVVPTDAEHMFDAAMASTGCRLTAIGAHYRALAAKRRI